MTAISYHDTVNDVQAIDLASRGPFGRRDWFAALESSAGRPFYAVAADASGGVVFPLRRTGRRLEALLNWYAFTWRPLGTAYASIDSLSIALAGDLARQTSHVVLDRIPDEDGTARQLQRAFERSGWLVVREACDTNRVLEVGGRSFAEYLEGRPGQVRTTLKRKAMKVDVTILDRFDTAAWEDYEAIYSESWKPEEGDPALLRRFAEAEGAAGRIRLAVAKQDGVAVAAQFWTVEDGVAYIHKLAHRESAKPLSPGTTLTAALMERVIDGDGVQWVDFGTGDDPYKQDWMEDARPRYRLQCWRANDPRNWPAIGKAKLRTLVSRDSRG
ncbi:GNAT family N-acetyltransferase [Croceibacterium salegens]|uniref:GNAT family N-acetyltransferase n=1 Tax=Croceibacterium salegens TaxID=1737568 RepID=UPI000A5644DA